MNWKNRLTKNREIKAGDIVKFKDPNSPDAHYFSKGLENLEVKSVVSPRLIMIYESDKSNQWCINKKDVELQ